MSPRRRPSLIGTLLQLEERTAPANLRLTGVVLVDATNAPEANPVYGQNTFVRAEWASEAMAGTEPAVPVRYTANFPVNYFFPGSSAVSYPADSAAINLGTGSGSWSTYRGGWYAGTAPFTITITLDPNNQIAETDETDNTLTVTVTPITPTDLPMKFLRQIQTTPNRDWSITNYVDVDPRAQSFADYQLGAYTYDGHDAIDAGPWNFAAQDAGIPVTAVADGVVDQIDGGNNFDRETALNNRPWNAVWINHGNGWRTVYAHLAAGSITVKVGDPVTVGRVLGLMGSSGDSNGTHAHYTAYYRGAQIEAGFSLSTYWINPLPYGGDVPGFYLESGIADHSPFQFAGESQEKVAQYTSVGVNSPGSQNMFFYVQGYNLKTTDVMYFQWVRPDGSVLNTSSFSPSGNFTYSSWWWSRPQAAFQTSPGTWQIVYYLNGTNPAHEQRRQSFAVVNGTGAGSLRMTDSAGSPVIDGRTTPIDFGSAVAGGSPVQKSFTLFNTAFGSLTLGNFVLPPGFSLVSAPASIAGNGSGVVILQMDTTAVGLKFGSVRFDTNDPDIGMFEFVVSGTVTGSVPTGSPVIGLGAAAALEFASGSPALVLAPTATLTDPDSISFNSLAVELATFGGPDDRLAIRNQGTGTGQIGLGATGPTVLYEGGPIGTFAGGTGTTPLVVTLGSNATLAATQALLRNITYRNVSTAPSSQRKAVRFTLTDDTGLASNQLIQHVINTPDTAPTIRSNGGGPTAAVSVPENTTAVTNVVSVDPDPGQPLNYTLAGPDAARFQISPTGVLTFATAPDFENPTDVGANNVYEVTVQVSDGLLTATQAIAVTVTDVAAGSLQFAASNYATAEGNSGTTNVTLTITRTGGNDATSVNYATANGTATAGSDYTAVSGTLSWAADDTGSKTFTVPILGDTIAEANETFTATLSGPTAGATLGSPNPATVTITNDDTLKVVALTSTSSGFVVDFNGLLSPGVLNLYMGIGITGPADLSLTGPTGMFPGSLVLNPAGSQATFVATGGVLLAGSYTVVLRAAANGFVDLFGNVLDGDGNGTPGDDYSGSFTASPSGRVLGVPDFARGAGQSVNVPSAGSGLPLRIGDAAGVTNVEADLLFDSTLLTISTGAFAAAFGGTLTVTAIVGGVHLSITGLTGAAGTNVAIANLTAAVPATAPYGAKEVLALRNVSVNGGAIQTVADDAVHVAAYLADTDGSRSYGGQDIFLLNQVNIGASGGLAAYPVLDPVVIGDADGSGTLSGQDAFLIGQKAIGGTAPQIPDLPTGVNPPPATGADPRLYLVGGAARPGETITIQLRIDVTNPAGIALSAGDYAIRFDPTRLRVSNVRTEPLLPGFTTAANVNNATGTIRIVQFARTPANFMFGTDGVVLLFDVTVLPGARPGRSPLNLVEKVTGNGSTTWTGLSSPAGPLALNPAPTDASTDPGDAVLKVLAPTGWRRLRAGI